MKEEIEKKDVEILTEIAGEKIVIYEEREIKLKEQEDKVEKKEKEV